MNQKPHSAVEKMVGAILADAATPTIAAADVAEVIRATLAAVLLNRTRTAALEAVIREIALTAHRAATESLNVADRLEGFARSPERWTLESFRDDLDALAEDLRGAWRMLDGIVGGNTTEAMDNAAGDADRQTEIAHEVAARFGVDPDSEDRKASMIDEVAT
jgi:hypothetical protein